MQIFTPSLYLTSNAFIFIIIKLLCHDFYLFLLLLVFHSVLLLILFFIIPLTHTHFLTKSLGQKRRRASSFERCFSRAFLLSEGNATRHNKTEICWKEDAMDGRQEGEFISEIKVRINKTENECTNVRTLAFARMHPRIRSPECVLRSSVCRKIFG